MPIMKQLPLVALFATALAAWQPAQQPTAQDPQQELAAVIAVEEQEGDLAKAEAMYRELLAGKTLSAAARVRANLRLGRLLERLGKDEAAKPFLQAAKGDVVSLDDVTDELAAQDVAREAALRAQARELLKEPSDLIRNDISWPELAGPLPERLLWIGRPAVPEIIATLESMGMSTSAGTGLNALLWRIGGPQAQTFLARSLAEESRRGITAAAAAAASDGEMLVFAGKQVAAVDWLTARVMLSNPTYASPNTLQQRLPPALLLDLAENRPAEVAAYVLDLYRQRSFDDTTLSQRYAALVERGLSSTDPALGTSAEKALASGILQGSIAGFELLLRILPSHPQLRLRWVGTPNDMVEPDNTGHVAIAAAQRLWPKSVACALQLGAEHRSHDWVDQLLMGLGCRLDAAIVHDVFALSDAGYRVIDLLQDKVTGDNAAEVLARADRVRASDRERFLRWFQQPRLPESLFPKMRELATEWGAKDPQFPVWRFAMPMARTGASEAAAWMRDCPLPRGWSPPDKALLELARINRQEAVLGVMRELIRDPKWSRHQLTMALLSMHDEATLDLVQNDSERHPHPYATVAPEAKPEELTPLEYLLYDNPNPPHGFSADDARRVVTRLTATNSLPVSPFVSIERLADPMLRMLAETLFGSVSMNGGEPRTWQKLALQRSRERGGKNDWQEWLQTALQTDRLQVPVLEAMNTAEIEQHLTTVEALRNNRKTSVTAIEALHRAGRPIDVPALLADGDPSLRHWAFQQVTTGKAQAPDDALVPFLDHNSIWVRQKAAEYLGAKVSTQAVPGLVRLLRDPNENVRTTAADSLTKIRFFHEQQAHWDRVFKGIDASATSAAEKLLLQGKPDQPKAQRLLAITSLGTLGVPEALPFLIDWTTDTDAEVAAAAKAAITQIHLQPRR